MRYLDDIRYRGKRPKKIFKQPPKADQNRHTTPAKASPATEQQKQPDKTAQSAHVRELFSSSKNAINKPLELIPRLSPGTIAGIGAIIALIGLALFSFFGGFQPLGPTDTPLPDDNLQDTSAPSVGENAATIQFNLRMQVNGRYQDIPQLSDDSSAAFTLQADNASGDVVLHYEEMQAPTLADLFAAWDSRFNRRCLLNQCLSGSREIIFLVNRNKNTEFGNYQLKDGDRIQIIFENRQ